MTITELSFIALLAVIILAKFVKNPIARIWGYFAIFMVYSHFVGLGIVDKLGVDISSADYLRLESEQRLFSTLMLFAWLLVIALPLMLIYLAFVKFYKKEQISVKMAFNAFSYIFWYSGFLVINALALMLCGVVYIIKRLAKQEVDFKLYLSSHIPLTAMICQILQFLGEFKDF